MKIKESILAEEGYLSEKELTRDVFKLHALAKIEKYQAECDFFQNKYNMDLLALEEQLHKRKGKEEIEKEQDLEDWEFAAQALVWWQNHLEEAKIAQNH